MRELGQVRRLLCCWGAPPQFASRPGFTVAGRRNRLGQTRCRCCTLGRLEGEPTVPLYCQAILLSSCAGSPEPHQLPPARRPWLLSARLAWQRPLAALRADASFRHPHAAAGECRVRAADAGGVARRGRRLWGGGAGGCAAARAGVMRCAMRLPGRRASGGPPCCCLYLPGAAPHMLTASLPQILSQHVSAGNGRCSMKPLGMTRPSMHQCMASHSCASLQN